MTEPRKGLVFTRSVEVALWAIGTLILLGTILFHYIEGWGWVDSFYFTGVSILTIGYGDLTPTHDLSKILTVVLGFGAVSTAFYAFSTIGFVIHHQIERLQDQVKIPTLSTPTKTNPVPKK